MLLNEVIAATASEHSKVGLSVRLSLGTLPYFAATAVALVPLHRAILRPSSGAGGRFPFRLGRSEWAYFVFLVSLGIAGTAVQIASIPLLGHGLSLLLDARLFAERAGPAAELLLVAAYLVVMLSAVAVLSYIPARLSLCLPAIALGQDRALPRGWRTGQGNGWRLLGALAVGLTPVMIAMLAAHMVFPEAEGSLTAVETVDGGVLIMEEESKPASPPIIINLAGSLIYAAAVLLEGAVLSISYRALCGLGPIASGTPRDCN